MEAVVEAYAEQIRRLYSLGGFDRIQELISTLRQVQPSLVHQVISHVQSKPHTLHPFDPAVSQAAMTPSSAMAAFAGLSANAGLRPVMKTLSPTATMEQQRESPPSASICFVVAPSDDAVPSLPPSFPPSLPPSPFLSFPFCLASSVCSLLLLSLLPCLSSDPNKRQRVEPAASAQSPAAAASAQSPAAAAPAVVAQSSSAPTTTTTATAAAGCSHGFNWLFSCSSAHRPSDNDDDHPSGRPAKHSIARRPSLLCQCHCTYLCPYRTAAVSRTDANTAGRTTAARSINRHCCCFPFHSNRASTKPINNSHSESPRRRCCSYNGFHHGGGTTASDSCRASLLLHHSRRLSASLGPCGCNCPGSAARTSIGTSDIYNRSTATVELLCHPLPRTDDG